MYFTRKPGEKAIGWDDIILIQTMRKPHLLPCGHIGDYDTLNSFQIKECSLDRQPFSMKELLPLSPHITRLVRTREGWSADIVDHERQKFGDKIIYHSCGEFYSFQFLKTTFGIQDPNQATTVLTNEALVCLSCFQPFLDHTTRTVFTSKLSDGKNFSNLDQVSLFTN